MKVLFLCHKTPYPPIDGGTIASLNMITGISKHKNETTVLAMQTPKHNSDISDIPSDLKESISWNQAFVDTNIKPIKLLTNLIFSKKPYNAVRFYSKTFKHELEQILSTHSFDIIQLEGLYLAPYIPTIRKASKAKISLRAHNIEWKIWKRMAENHSNVLKKAYFNILASRVKRMEYETLQMVDLLIPITNNDKSELPFKQETNIFVSPTGIKQNRFKENTNNNTKSLFHIGALDWLPNQEGLLWFLEKVWTPIKKENPNWNFYIAGRNAPEQFIKTISNYPVNYVGEVEDAAEFIDKHNIMIVPLFSGSGMRIKIIEGMARSKCIVTTEIGAEGIDIKKNKNIIIANDSEKMKSAITQLINNEALVKEIAENAYIFCKSNYENNYIIAELVNFYNTKIN